VTDDDASVRPLAAVFANLADRVRPYVRKWGYESSVSRLHEIILNGGEDARLREIFRDTGHLSSVTATQVRDLQEDLTKGN
jgi:gamma-glutamyl:cysteine ligase YbdK (ATP-grasp superfamily)